MNFDIVSVNLQRNGFGVHCFETTQQSIDYLDSQIDATTVGTGGSFTLHQMGIYERLAGHNTVYYHWTKSHGDNTRNLAATAEVYLCSVNALALSGEIINIDGACNRVANTLYGHKRVYFVVGRNKLAPDFDAAIYRARNIAAPRNAQRLGVNTPCAIRGDKCYNCNSPQRICRTLNVLWRAPFGTQYEVLLVNQDLGY